MPAAASERDLVAAQSALFRARRALEICSPDQLDSGQLALQEAISALGASHAALSGTQNSHLLEQVQHLRSEMIVLTRLLQSAAQFYAGWERILGAMSFGYTSTGDPSPVIRAASVTCRV